MPPGFDHSGGIFISLVSLSKESHWIMSTFVIALAGTSGAGKSTLMERLAARLGNANLLGLDDYEDSSVYPPVREWLARGADPNQFQTPQFMTDALALKGGRSIIHPVTKAVVNPARYLLLEEPFGRARAPMHELIDFLIYIEIPLEIAHARKLLRKNDFLPWENNPDLFMHNLREHLLWYIEFGRDFYLRVSRSARRDCDLIVDGTLSTDQMRDQIIEALNKKG
jgi:uridine kinase